MKFRTEVKIESNPGFITHKDKLLAIGSCFSSNMGEFLHQRQFEILYDQFGVLFNPVSIEKNIQNALEESVDEDLILERDGRFYHYDFPTNFMRQDKAELLEHLQSVQHAFSNRFYKSNRLMITFGTAWVYRLISQNQIVANCHKIPQKAFTKELLDLQHLKEHYTALFQDLKQRNPKLEILLTVSPVRHIKNGLHENNLSKSILLLLSNYLSGTFDYVTYFPAYELVIDDLRDYRFFGNDLIHPNSQAIDYVYERFQDAYFSDKTIEIAELSMQLSRLENHHFMAPSEKDLQQNKAQIEELRKRIELRLKGEA